MKQLYQKYDFERKDRESIISLNSWFDQYTNIDKDSETIRFAYINQVEYVSYVREAKEKLPNLDDLSKNNQNFKRFCQIIAVID